MKILLPALLCLLQISVFAQKQKTDKRFDGLDTAFARVLNDWHAAGFAVAVVEKDKVVYTKGFGYSDYQNKIPVTTNTQFAIGSCTKAFTASLMGMLKKDGLVDFDKPVRNYYPSLQFYNNEMNDHVTLRDMMSHRTGLPRHDFSWYLFPSHSMDSLVQRIQYQEPSAELREKWQYNNFMYMLQGAITKKITGKSWEDNIREKIFAPLGMTESNVSLKEWDKNPNAAKGYTVNKDTLYPLDHYDIAGMAPAGSINSTVNDMAKWVTTWIYGGKYQGKEIIPASYVNEAMSSQMVISSGFPSKPNADIFLANYGFGWMVSSYKGHYRVEHGGNIDGFSASTSFFPSDSIGIVVLTNQNGSQIPAIVRNIIAERMLNLKRFDWESDSKNKADSAKKMQEEAEKSVVANKEVKNPHPTHPLKDYEGVYNNKGYGNFIIDLEHDSLLVSAGITKGWLRPYHYDVFDFFTADKKTGVIDTTDQNFPKLTFNINESGDIANLSANLGADKPIVFDRKPKVKPLTKDSLLQFTGEFVMGGNAVKIFIKGENKLMMFVPGQSEFELFPLGEYKFSLNNLPGYFIQFNKDDKNEVIELLSIQPNGTFKAIRKK